MNMLQAQVKKPAAYKASAHSHKRATHKYTLKYLLSTCAGLHSCKLLPAFSKTSPWTEASASAAINHAEAGAEGKAHLVHVAPTPGLNKP